LRERAGEGKEGDKERRGQGKGKRGGRQEGRGRNGRGKMEGRSSPPQYENCSDATA